MSSPETIYKFTSYQGCFLVIPESPITMLALKLSKCSWGYDLPIHHGGAPLHPVQVELQGLLLRLKQLPGTGKVVGDVLWFTPGTADGVAELTSVQRDGGGDRRGVRADEWCLAGLAWRTVGSVLATIKL